MVTFANWQSWALGVWGDNELALWVKKVPLPSPLPLSAELFFLQKENLGRDLLPDPCNEMEKTPGKGWGQ